jgi:tripartite ATP-independent transporter DctP family solute receptor
MRNYRSTILSLALGLGLGLVLGTSGAALAQEQLKLAHGLAPAPNSHHGIAAATWGSEIGTQSQGRFTVQEFPASALGGEREMVEGVLLGTIDMVVVSSGTLGNFVPAVGVFDVPFLFRDADHARLVMDGPIGDELLGAFEGSGLVAIAWGEQGFRHITSNKGPIRKPADLLGQKIRTMENPIHLTAFQALGAAPTPMAWPEVMGALQQGTIDGQENPLAVIVSAKLAGVQKHATLSAHVYSPSLFLVSEKRWNQLSAEDREIFRDAARKGVAEMRAFVDGITVSGVETLKASGMEIVELTPEEHAAFRDGLAEAYVGYRQTFGSELIDRIISAQ